MRAFLLLISLMVATAITTNFTTPTTTNSTTELNTTQNTTNSTTPKTRTSATELVITQNKTDSVNSTTRTSTTEPNPTQNTTDSANSTTSTSTTEPNTTQKTTASATPTTPTSTTAEPSTTQIATTSATPTTSTSTTEPSTTQIATTSATPETPTPTALTTTLVTTTPETSTGSDSASTPVTPPSTSTEVGITTQAACEMNICQNGGTFLQASCECLCPPKYAGTSCEVSYERNTCVENPTLCTGEGQYCEANTKRTGGEDHVCLCNILNGYAEDGDNKCVKRKAFTTSLAVTKIGNDEITFEPEHSDPNSKAAQEIFDRVTPIIYDGLKNDSATANVTKVVGVSLSKGSIIVETVALFPANDDVTLDEIKNELETDSLGKLALNKDKFVAEESSAGEQCSFDSCFHGGTCVKAGIFPELRLDCKCRSSFDGPKCENVVTEVFSPLVIAAIVFGGFGLLLVGVFVVGYICLKVNKRKRKGDEEHETEEQIPMEYDNSGFRSPYFAMAEPDTDSGSPSGTLSRDEEKRMIILTGAVGRSPSYKLERAKSPYEWDNRPAARAKIAPNEPARGSRAFFN